MAGVGAGGAARARGRRGGRRHDAYAYAVAASDAGATAPLETEFEPEQVSFWQSFGAGAPGRVFAAFFGRHGVVSHFPVVLVGILGVTMVMHRHWPSTTKVLAAGTLVGGLVIILLYAFRARPVAGDVRHAVVRRVPPADGVLGGGVAAAQAPAGVVGGGVGAAGVQRDGVDPRRDGPLPPDGFGNAYTAAGSGAEPVAGGTRRRTAT